MMTEAEIIKALIVGAIGWAIVLAIHLAKRWWERRNPSDWQQIQDEVKATGSGGLSDAWLTYKLQWRSIWRYFTA